MLRTEYVATYPRPQMDNSATPAAAGMGSVETDSSVLVRLHRFPRKDSQEKNKKMNTCNPV